MNPREHAPLALDATGQAELIRNGEITSDELVDLALRRIDEVNGDVNAVIWTDERAVAGGRAEAPFAGVPLLLKDLGLPAQGHPDHRGNIMRKRAGMTFERDCETVRRLREAGFVLIGRTNSAELGFYSDTQNAAYGITRNPWDLERSTGGSSGGSAAAVSAGITAIAQGTDGGGSVRNPAAHCGLVGLKVSRGVISGAPGGEAMLGNSQTGFLTRSVRDTAAIVDVVAGTVPGDPVIAPNADDDFSRLSRAGATGLRIGVLDHDPEGEYEVPEPVRAAVRKAGRLLSDLGQNIDNEYPSAMFEHDLWDHWFRFNLPFALLEHDTTIAETGQVPDFDPIVDYWVGKAKEKSQADHLVAIDWLNGYRRRMARWWEHHDVLVTPVLVDLPRPVGGFWGSLEAIEESVRILRFTPQFNCTGQPAITVPMGFSENGLPLAVQLVGRYGSDATLLDLASQIETAHPWVTSTLAS